MGRAKSTSKTLKGHSSVVATIAFSSHGGYNASGSAGRTTRLWEIATCNYRTLQSQSGPVVAVDFSPDSKFIASGYYDWIIRPWNAATGH